MVSFSLGGVNITGVLIVLAYLFGKYQDFIINYFKIKKNVKKDEFYDCVITDKDFEKDDKK